MKIRTLPAAAALGFAVLAGAGGAYALTAASPSVVQQSPTVQFRSAAVTDPAPDPGTPPAPAADPVPVVAPPVAAHVVKRPAPVEPPAPSAPKAKVAAAPVQDPAPAPAEDPVAPKTTPAAPALDPAAKDTPRNPSWVPVLADPNEQPPAPKPAG